MTKNQNINYFKFLKICLIIYLNLVKNNIVSCKNLNNYESVNPLEEIIQTRPTSLNKSGPKIVYTRYIKKSPIENLNNEYVEDIVEYFDTLLQPPKFGSAENDITKFLENDHEYRKQISKLSNNKNCSTKVIEREISTTTTNPSLSPASIYLTNYPQTVKTMTPIIKVEILPSNKNISKPTLMIYRPETSNNDVYYYDEVTESTKSPAPTTTTTTKTAAPIKISTWLDGLSTIKTILVNTTTIRPTTSIKPPTTTQKQFSIDRTTTNRPFISTTTPTSFKSTTNTTTTIKPTSNLLFGSFFNFPTTAKTTTTTTVSTTPTTTTTQAPIISTTNSLNKESPIEEEDDDDTENYDDENDNEIDKNNDVDKKEKNLNLTNTNSYDYTNGEDTDYDEQLTHDETTKKSLWSYWK